MRRRRVWCWAWNGTAWWRHPYGATCADIDSGRFVTNYPTIFRHQARRPQDPPC